MPAKRVFKIAVLAGDGIGPEIVAVTLKVLKTLESHFDFTFDFQSGLIGGAAFDVHGSHFPAQTEALCRACDAILLGAVGGPANERNLPKWQSCEANSILALRKTFQFFANYRPAMVYPELRGLSPLRSERISEGVDLLILRELIGDVYFGEHVAETINGERTARDSGSYTESQIAAIAHRAFQAATNRRRRVTSVDKANVLEMSRLWRAVVSEIALQYPDVTCDHMFVDNCAMQIVLNPGAFDVVVTSNLFGDILSDAAAVLPGSLGLVPSASLNAAGFGLYEPAGGSAPEIAGKGVANPIAQILSAAMMLEFSFGEIKAARTLESAVRSCLKNGIRTKDLTVSDEESISTAAMGDAIIHSLRA